MKKVILEVSTSHAIVEIFRGALLQHDRFKSTDSNVDCSTSGGHKYLHRKKDSSLYIYIYYLFKENLMNTIKIIKKTKQQTTARLTRNNNICNFLLLTII